MNGDFSQRFFGLALLVAASLLLASCRSAVSSSGTDPAADRIERGRYLVNIGVCNDCHTPMVMGPDGPGPDMSRMLSGHPQDMRLSPPPLLDETWTWAGVGTNTAFFGPWGISYSANLTPDENTGLGIWSEEMFINAIRSGRHMGQSRPIQPPMPWPFYSKMSDEDLKSIYAYLRSLPPIHNRVPDYQPPPELLPE
ncbi:MAG TPA: c-type cytochrome [Acidobacteriota bacterium]|nr:c-type cytochrome [Acidobacteriota bacterium]